MLTLARIMQATAPSPSVPNAAACRVYKGTTVSFFLTPELWPWPPMPRASYLQWSPSRSNVSPPPGRPGSDTAGRSSCWRHKLHNLSGMSRGFGQGAGPQGDLKPPTPFLLSWPCNWPLRTPGWAEEHCHSEECCQSSTAFHRLFSNVPKQVFQGWFQSRESQSSTSNTSVCLDFWQVDYVFQFLLYCHSNDLP